MNKEQTKLPEAIEEVLDAVAEHMGVLEAKPSDVSPYIDYGDLLIRALGNLRDVHATYNLVQSEDWQEIQRLQREEKERLEAERWEKSRDNIMVGVVHSLCMKFRKAFPDAEITMNIDRDGAYVSAFYADDVAIEVEYIPSTRNLFVSVQNDEFDEDATKVNGNQAPVDQFKGLAAVYDYLAENEKKEN